MDETPPAFDWTAFWANVDAFFSHPLVKALLLVVFALVLNWALRLGIRRVVNRVVTGAKKKHSVDDTQALISSPLAAARVVQRTRALGTVFNSAVTAIITIVILLLVISIVFPNATGAFAIVSAAIGAGLGFGAQNIVKDVLNGIFMVAEDQLGVGDVVDVGEATGTVEEVGLRITKVRSVDGTLWFVRNGEILRVGNFSHDWARVIIDLPAPYTADVSAIQETLLETATAMSNSPAWRSKILEKPEIWGIESVSAEAIVIRLVMKARPAEQWAVARELRLRLKHALDEINVGLPALNRVVIDSPDVPQPVGRRTQQPTTEKEESGE
ncbi:MULTISPECIES: mechanosensitive ion channel family protein [unclassified Cryobacterium]|uniref:mechanosensitive ion channel family protein n=1 Tax=unclassified Cryobacterium TaxID=2649013 RepID=UPI0014468B62|nr:MULTISPECIES: mechanosensitive ion channel family protein [unclassified Cryobacterium]